VVVQGQLRVQTMSDGHVPGVVARWVERWHRVVGRGTGRASTASLVGAWNVVVGLGLASRHTVGS